MISSTPSLPFLFAGHSFWYWKNINIFFSIIYHHHRASHTYIINIPRQKKNNEEQKNNNKKIHLLMPSTQWMWAIEAPYIYIYVYMFYMYMCLHIYYRVLWQAQALKEIQRIFVLREEETKNKNEEKNSWLWLAIKWLYFSWFKHTLCMFAASIRPFFVSIRHFSIVICRAT